MRDAGCKAKMHNKYTDPYQITNILSTDLYFLKDKHSHQLKRPIPPNQLVRYYGVGGFCKSDVKVENCESDSSDMETGEASQSEDENNVSQMSSSKRNGCQRTRVHKLDANKKCTSDGISQLQILIMQSNDNPFSSDESIIEVASLIDDDDDVDINNPWADMDVQDIPLDIKDEDSDISDESSISSSSLTVTAMEKGSDVIFSSLSDMECLNAARKFYVKLQLSDHTVSYRGIGLVFEHKPVVTVAAKPDGACLFNSISLLLCGSDVYSQII